MNEEVDYRNAYGATKKSSKKWIVIGIIVVVLIVLMLSGFIGWTIYQKNVYNKAYYSVFFDITQNNLNQLNNENVSYSSIEEMQAKMSASKNKVSNNFILVENTGKVKVWDKEFTRTCDDGTMVKGLSKYGQFEELNCSGSTTIERSNELKEYEVNGTSAIKSLAVDSLMIFTGETILKELDQNEGKSFSTEEVKGNLAHDLFHIIRTLQMRGGIHYAIGYENISWGDNTQDKVKKIREYSLKMSVPTQAEIENVDIYGKACMDINDEVISPIGIGRDSGNLYSPELNSPITGLALFDIEPILKPTKKFCRQFDRVEKESAIRMLNSLSSETNPLMVIYSKAYLNMFVKCSEIPITQECTNYMQNLGKDFSNYINSIKS